MDPAVSGSAAQSICGIAEQIKTELEERGLQAVSVQLTVRTHHRHPHGIYGPGYEAFAQWITGRSHLPQLVVDM